MQNTYLFSKLTSISKWTFLMPKSQIEIKKFAEDIMI